MNDGSGHALANGDATGKKSKSSKDTDGDKKKEKKKKSKKGSDEPGVSQIKKPLSAYMLFNNSRRPTLQAEYTAGTVRSS